MMLPDHSTRELTKAKRLPVILAGIFLFALKCLPATAEVRFGRNVYIGGHDFSHQRYDRKHRAVIRLYDRRLRREGCASRSDGRGGRIKICHLRKIGPR